MWGDITCVPRASRIKLDPGGEMGSEVCRVTAEMGSEVCGMTAELVVESEVCPKTALLVWE